MTQSDVTSGPGVTALGLAAARSVESGRPDRLIVDEHARALFSSADSDLPMLLDWPTSDQPVTEAQKLHLHGSRYIGLRTRFYDDLLLTAMGQGIHQVVLVGAGLDTRAFRLPLSDDTRLFELDQPVVLDYKDAVLAHLEASTRCDRAAVGADLREDWTDPLLRAGFNRHQPTAWIAEGLLPYLPAASQLTLTTRISALSAAASTLSFDNIIGNPSADGRLKELSDRSGIDMQTLIPDTNSTDLVDTLIQHGWAVTLESTAALAERYGRDLSDPFTTPTAAIAAEPPWLETVFVTARRTAGSGQ